MSEAKHLLICLMILVFVFLLGVCSSFVFSFDWVLGLFLLISCYLYIKEIVLFSICVANIFPSLSFFLFTLLMMYIFFCHTEVCF